MTALFCYPAPVVGLVNGHTIAGGCILTLCCDHRVALPSPGCKIGLNELALGLRFPPRIMAIVRRRVPPRHIERVVLGAELFDPRTALELGLVDELAEDGRAAAERALARLAGHEAEAYAATKLTLRRDAFGPTHEDESFFTREVLPAWTSPGVRARVTALLAQAKSRR
jgi:enoyl-CoA hydratase